MTSTNSVFQTNKTVTTFDGGKCIMKIERITCDNRVEYKIDGKRSDLLQVFFLLLTLLLSKQFPNNFYLICWSRLTICNSSRIAVSRTF